MVKMRMCLALMPMLAAHAMWWPYAHAEAPAQQCVGARLRVLVHQLTL